MTDLMVLYPDVLGMVAGNGRIGLGTLQFAVGISPTMTYIGQPVEVVLILQNIINRAIEVKIALGLPNKSDDGKPVTLITPRKQVAFQMKAGEVGVLRLPVLPMQPSQPSPSVPIRVAVRQRVDEKEGDEPAQLARPVLGGAPPSELAVSPFQLQVLRDVDYVIPKWDQSPESVEVRFNIVPSGIMTPRKDEIKPRYTTLWQVEQMTDERARVQAQLDEARIIASDVMAQIPASFPMLKRMVHETYAARGLSLNEGEVFAIAKMLAYTFTDHSAVDRRYQLEDLRWFQTLCGILAFDQNTGRKPAAELVANYLFHAALYDAVLLAYGVIRPYLRVALGDKAERIAQANHLLAWLVGGVAADVNFIYAPLALGGIAIHADFTLPNEEPFIALEEIRQAYRQRLRLADEAHQPLFEMVDKLIAHSELTLKKQNDDE